MKGRLLCSLIVHSEALLLLATAATAATPLAPQHSLSTTAARTGDDLPRSLVLCAPLRSAGRAHESKRGGVVASGPAAACSWLARGWVERAELLEPSDAPARDAAGKPAAAPLPCCRGTRLQRPAGAIRG